jgi:hypothetical protein
LQAGLKVISDDKCCRLLAWVYVYGGINEQAVLDNRLHTALMYAQNRMIFKGNFINNKLVTTLQGYVSSISDYHNPPDWLIELEKEYGINISHKPVFGGVQGNFK